MDFVFRTNDLSNVNNANKIKEILKTSSTKNIVLLSSRNPSYVIESLNDTFMKDFNWILSRPDSTEEFILSPQELTVASK